MTWGLPVYSMSEKNTSSRKEKSKLLPVKVRNPHTASMEKIRRKRKPQKQISGDGERDGENQSKSNKM